MAITKIPENCIEVGKIEVVVYFNSEDEEYGKVFSVENLDNVAAIGYLQVTADRLRDRAKYQWDTCPDCGQPWEEHDDEDDEDEEA